MADNTAQQNQPFEVPDTEIVTSFSGPALHANKILISNLPSGVRIAFLEALADQVQPLFRTAVLLGFGDAIALRDLLNHQLRDIEPQIKQAEAAAQKATSNG